MKLVFAILTTGLFCACALFGPQERWAELEIKKIPSEELWDVAKGAMRHANFKIQEEDRARGVLASAWDLWLSPYARQEKRERATIQIEPAADGSFKLRVRVEKEINNSLSGTMNPEAADWTPTADDELRARAIVQYILLKTEDFGPSQDFYERRKMREGTGG